MGPEHVGYQRKQQNKHDFDHAAGLHQIADIQRRSIESMSLELRLCVLDVGCGSGASTLALGAAVGVAGVVHGVDYDAMMIAEARKRALLEGVDARVFTIRRTPLRYPDRMATSMQAAVIVFCNTCLNRCVPSTSCCG